MEAVFSSSQMHGGACLLERQYIFKDSTERYGPNILVQGEGVIPSVDNVQHRLLASIWSQRVRLCV